MLTGSTTLSSKQYLQQLMRSGQVDLLLTPPVRDFEILGFDGHRRLYEIGYEDARERLAAWDGLAAIRAGRAPSSTATP